MNQQEIYIPIQGFPKYAISNHGNVKNLKTGKMMKQTMAKAIGYYVLTLRNSDGATLKYVHRLIALHFIPNPEALPQVDHINRDRSDNRIDNLRWVTAQQNDFNRTKRKETSSSYKGVSWHKKNNKWSSYIRIDGKLMSLGQFDEETEAARAYNEKATELFGEHANLNVIPDN